MPQNALPSTIGTRKLLGYHAITPPMSIFSGFADDLAAIDGSVDSISTLSAYIRMHPGDAEDIISVRGDSLVVALRISA